MVYSAQAFGLAATTDSADALTWLNRARWGVLSHRQDMGEALTAALKEDPSMTLPWALRGLSAMFLARVDRLHVASQALSRAEQSLLSRGGTPEEHAIVSALRSWSHGAPMEAADLLRQACVNAPQNLLLMKLEHGCRFMAGDKTGMLQSLERLKSDWSATMAGLGYAEGMLAFALEQNGHYDAALEAGLSAVKLEPDDGAAIHAVSHVYEMCERHEENERWLAHHLGSGILDESDNTRGHALWHLCLAQLQVGKGELALGSFEEILDWPTGDFREVSNGASLLYRLEELDIDVGERWQILADRIEGDLSDHGYAFADVHYCLTLVKAGRLDGARALAKSLESKGCKTDTHRGRVQMRLGLPLVRGILMLAESGADRHRAAAAFDQLAVAADGAQGLGGSHAQRDLLRRIWVEAGKRSRDPERLDRALRAYLTSRPMSTWAREQSARACCIRDGLAS